MCPSVVMKTTEPSKVKCSPEVLINTAEGSLVSSSVNPDLVIRTGSDDRTNNMKLDRIKGQTDLSAVSPSSDSGVHSVDEEWDCMSTYSGESDSIQSVKTVYGGVCQTDRPVVKLRNMDSRGVMDTLEGRYGDQDSVPSVSTNGHKSDIADMGDFSDEEEGQWEEVEPEERRNRYKIADIGDYFRDPDARARFELSQAKSAITMGYTYFNDTGDGGATGMGENMTGNTVAEENEYIRVSMISVDEHRTVQSDFKHDSLGIRDCALPECATQPILAVYEDSTSCVRESLPSMTTSCFGLCGLTNQFYNTDFEWCVKCVNRLLWGFIVSCVVSIVGRDIDVFITGCDVLVSIGARLDGLITPGDAMRLCLWRTEDFKDMLHIVMCDYWTGLIRLDIPWGEDNRPVRATHAAVDTGSIRAGGRFGCWDRPVRSADWLDVRPMDGGPVGTDVWIKYIGDSLWGYQSTDAAPLTGVHDTNINLQIDSDCFARLCSTRIVYLTVRISWSLEEVVQCGVISSLTQTMDGAALANDRSGITFTADLCVPWDAPEAVIEMNSPDLISLETIPDKVGLFGRRKEAAMCRIMSARDCRGVRFVVPDVRLVDRGFHDVTVIDMEDDRNRRWCLRI